LDNQTTAARAQLDRGWSKGLATLVSFGNARAMIDLSTRHVLVIGASGSIGGAVCESALATGAAVTGTASSVEGRAARDRMTWRALDLRSHGVIEEWIGELTITDIVSAAAARPFASLAEMSADDLTALVDTKLWGSFHIGRAAARLPAHGTLTFISGLLASYPDAASPVAAVSAAVEALGRGLAVELAPIRVNVVSPDGLGSAGRGSHEGTPADVAEAILSTITNEWMSGSVIDLHGAGKP
jgi:NAD(P)-dependent dehydrogenase (short-subunit alcohol dehydrogenase family)